MRGRGFSGVVAGMATGRNRTITRSERSTDSDSRECPTFLERPEISRRHVLFTVAATREADRIAVESGISIAQLMANAGRRVAESVMQRWPLRRTEVLCGPGDNGGDGYVAALRLFMAGWPVTIRALGAPNSTAASAAADRWTAAGGKTSLLDTTGAESILAGGTDVLLVDALFGAGLSRPLTGPAAEIALRAQNADADVLSVDVPSGVDGDSGRVEGVSFNARVTVAFERARPGHFLGEGGGRTGRLLVLPIGIPVRILDRVAGKSRIIRNHPAAWPFRVGRPHGSPKHKYRYGHVLVYAGPPGRGGAARLAARAALRTGAGLATVVPPQAAVPEHAAQLDAVMVHGIETARDWTALLRQRGASAAVIGPGAGRGAKKAVIAALESQKDHIEPIALVLDADALTAFEEQPEQLFQGLAGHPALLTPHTGEFSRLFPDLGAELGRGTRSAVDIVRDAARRSHAVVLLKGRCTVISSPDGTAFLNDTTGPMSVPWLATAGAGDALAGAAGAFAAGGARLDAAAAAASWVHAEAARIRGPGLTADDLPELLPAALNEAIRLQGG